MQLRLNLIFVVVFLANHMLLYASDVGRCLFIPDQVQSMINLEINDKIHLNNDLADPVHTAIKIRGSGCDVSIVGITNIVLFRPLGPQICEVHLYSEDGKEVQRRWFDRDINQKLELDQELADGSFRTNMAAMYGHSREMRFNYNGEKWFCHRFDILKSFRLSQPGNYRIRIEVRLFEKNTNNIFVPRVLPACEVEFKIAARGQNSWVDSSGSGSLPNV